MSWLLALRDTLVIFVIVFGLAFLIGALDG